METVNETALVPAGYDHHGPLLHKWLTNLMYIRIASLALLLLTPVSRLTNITLWISRLLSVGVIVVMFRLAAANGRYRKAAIFSCITLAGNLFNALTSSTVFNLVVSICSIIAEYQEFHGHAEICADKDPALSGRWERLFWWQVGVGIIGGVLLSFGVIIGVLAGAEAGILTAVTLILNAAISIGIGLVCLNALKKTIVLYL